MNDVFDPHNADLARMQILNGVNELRRLAVGQSTTDFIQEQ